MSSVGANVFQSVINELAVSMCLQDKVPLLVNNMVCIIYGGVT